MILTGVTNLVYLIRIPRESGDDPTGADLPVLILEYSPRERG